MMACTPHGMHAVAALVLVARSLCCAAWPWLGWLGWSGVDGMAWSCTWLGLALGVHLASTCWPRARAGLAVRAGRARWAGPVRAGRARAGRACAWCAAAGPAHGLRAVHAAGLFTSLVGCLGRAMVRTVACLWAAAGSSSLVNGRVMPSTMSPSWLVKARWPVFSYTRAPYKAPACTWGRGWLSSTHAHGVEAG